jgi:hypothetical protein
MLFPLFEGVITRFWLRTIEKSIEHPQFIFCCVLSRVAFNRTVGISVDTHVHRICNLLGWVGKEDPKRTPEQTRLALESWVPPELWADFNITLVGLGQEIQTESRKLVLKCAESSDPEFALGLICRCGMDRKKIAQYGLRGVPVAPD